MLTKDIFQIKEKLNEIKTKECTLLLKNNYTERFSSYRTIYI